MRVEEFVRAVTVADFVKLAGPDNLLDFAAYSNAVEDAGQENIVIRLLFQIEQPDGVPLPYYVWLVYPCDGGELAVYPPDYDNLGTYLETPEELQNQEYFEIIVGD